MIVLIIVTSHSYAQRLIVSPNGRYKAAQPLEMEGTIISQKNGIFVDGLINEIKDVISGYYHILASKLDEAIKKTEGG